MVYSHFGHFEYQKSSKIIETKIEIENGLNIIFNKAIGGIIAACICVSLALIVFLICNFWVKCCPNLRVNGLFKTLTEERNLEANEELEAMVTAPIQIQMSNLKIKESKDDFGSPPIQLVVDSVNDSLDSITNRFIESTA